MNKSISICISLILSVVVIVFGIVSSIQEKSLDKEYLKDLQDAENSKE